MDENNFQRIRNIISKCPKKQQRWSQLTTKHFSNQDEDNQAYDPIWAGKLGMLVKDFLELVSGGEVVEMLTDILEPNKTQMLPSCADVYDKNGNKRLEKLNSVIQKSSPLKPWVLRTHSNKTRQQVETTARKSLEYLSGGQMIPLLRDILYPNEKEMLAEKYRIALIRIGETTKQMKPKPKAMILNAIRQSGFAKDDLREIGWTFSTHLWNSSRPMKYKSLSQGFGMGNYANDGPVDYSSRSGRFPSLQDNGDHYEEEIYFRSVSRSRNDLTSNEDNDNDFQNQVILNNFVDQFDRRQSNFSIQQDNEKQFRNQMVNGYRKQQLFPKLF